MPKKSAKKQKPKPRAAGVAVLVSSGKRASEADRKRAESLVSLIERRKARIVEDFFEIGVALRALQRAKLYFSLGYATFAKMLAGRNLMGQTQASKLVAVADAYDRDQALALGLEKAYQLIRYTEATPEPDSPAFLLATHAKIGKKPIEAASVRELVDATRVQQAKKHAKSIDPAEHEAQRRARALQAALRKRGAHRATVTSARIGRAWVLRVEVPVAEAKVLER